MKKYIVIGYDEQTEDLVEFLRKKGDGTVKVIDPSFGVPRRHREVLYTNQENYVETYFQNGEASFHMVVDPRIRRRKERES